MSRHKSTKVWLADALLCQCTWPPQRMQEGLWGFTCTNTQCREYISKRNAKLCEHTKLDTQHVMATLGQMRGAEKAGRYLQSRGDD